jgi:hypothetical protein
MSTKRYGCAAVVAGVLALGVPLVAQKPSNATAQCSDGTYSTAKTERGACSKHGGVKSWFGGAPSAAPAAPKSTAPAAPKATAPAAPKGTAPAAKESRPSQSGQPAGTAPRGSTGQCTDGSYTRAKTEKGACSNHGGVKTWFGIAAPVPAPTRPAPANATPANPTPANSAPPQRPAPSSTAPRTAPAPTAPAQRPAPSASGSGKAQTVAAPAGTPENATAKCKDGTYSFAKGHSGACSRHGGVAEWYR